MKKYIEFCDTRTIDSYVSAVDALNKFTAENESLKVSVVGYRVVRDEHYGKGRTYILAEIELLKELKEQIYHKTVGNR